MRLSMVRLSIAIITFILIVPLFAAGQANSARVNVSAAASAEEEVRQLEREFIAARRQARRGDPAALNRILAESFTGTSLRGRRMNKAQFVRSSGNPNLRFTSFRTDETNMRIYGESALSTGRATIAARNEDNPISFQFRYALVYAKQGGRWQIIGLHLTRIAQP